MLDIYTDIRLIPDIEKYPDERIVKNIDMKFNSELRNITNTIDRVDKKMINDVDGSNIIEVEGDIIIKSKYGTTLLDNISTGCKTCILCKHLKNSIIDLTLCGENAIKCILENIESSGNKLILRHNQFRRMNKYTININGNKAASLADLWDTIVSENEGG